MAAELVAGAFLSSFFDAIFERLASVDFKDYFRRGKLERLVEELKSTLNSINPVLDDAEQKQYESEDVKKWLGDVKHAMYEADQLLDEIATDAPLKKRKAESSSIVSGFISAFTNPFEPRIKELLKNLDSLAKQKDTLGLQKGTCARNKVGLSPKPSERQQSTSLVDESSIYGRDGDKAEIIKYLLSENDSGNQVPVISIVGLGGMGKTTLAQFVYNDQRMQEHFELKAWVYVSESFDVIGLTKAILKSFQLSADGDYLNQLQQQLQQRLMGKKYLLVLDDVWNGNEESWEQLLLPFNHGSSGSKIIVTTRDKGVASVMKSTQLLHLQQLEKSNCWSLFVKHAFHDRNVSEYPNLESIGKKIVDKCGGLPLAVKALGSLLRRKFSKREWVKILKTGLWCLLEGDSKINPVLRLSYHNLPSNLKRCFAYCSIIPKGYPFEKDELVQLWMAEGLLKCYETDKSEEELGNEFFDDLESISFFQQYVDPLFYISNQDSWPNVKYYFIMHDLVNDLAKSVSGEFFLRIEYDRVQDITERTRHIWWRSLDLLVEQGNRNLEHICKIKGLRSLVIHEDCDSQPFKIFSNVQHDLFSSLRYLRVLTFHGCFLPELVDEISNLKQLRYLELFWTHTKSLPDSISMLHNLQTLILKGCELTELPSDFYKLVNLHHLILKHTNLKKMPKQIGRLNHLQTLTSFVVGEHSGSDIKELAKLNHLQGTLHIIGLENVIDLADAAATNLKDKKNLEELNMVFCLRGQMDASIIERDVLEALQPNSNLNRLTIRGYSGSSFPHWLGDCYLPNLVCLRLDRCEFCARLPPLGQLPSLKNLSILGCRGIEIIGPEFYGNSSSSSNVPFRFLEILKFDYMYSWKEWLCLEGFPLLKELFIENCPKLKRALPQQVPSLQKLVISGCQELETSILKADNITLSTLEISNCPKLIALREGWSLFELNSLKEFTVSDDFENVESFPEESLLPPTLNTLNITSCSKLRIINYRGLLHLKSLKSLHIVDCPRLQRLPEEGLPNSLSTLCIFACSLLSISTKRRKESAGIKFNTSLL